MAFTLGAMGSATTNFYNDAFKRGGWEAAAREVQRLWIAGKRPEAIAKVPPEMVIEANLLGDTEMVREPHPGLQECGRHHAARRSRRARPRGEAHDARAGDGSGARLSRPPYLGHEHAAPGAASESRSRPFARIMPATEWVAIRKFEDVRKVPSEKSKQREMARIFADLEKNE